MSYRVESGEGYQFQADLIRTIASWLVVFHHTIILVYLREGTVTTSEWIVVSFIRCLTLYGVPFFILLSGALHLTKKNFSAAVMFNKMMRLLITYIIWSTIFIVIKLYIFDKSISVTDAITLILTGKAEYHLYFVPIILWMYAVTGFLRKLFEKKYEKILYCILVVSIIYSTVSWIQSDWLKNELPLDYFQPAYTLRFVSLYLLGGILWRNKKISSMRIVVSIAFVELQLITSTIYTFFYSKNLGYGTLFLFLDKYYALHYIAATAILFSLIISNRFFDTINIVKNFVQFWSKHSEQIYFIHPLALYAFSYAFLYLGYNIADLPLIGILAIGLTIGFVSLFFSEVIRNLANFSKQLFCNC